MALNRPSHLLRFCFRCSLFLFLLNPLSAADELFLADFQEDKTGGPPSANWRSVSGPASGTAEIAIDEENLFGDGTGKQFLRVRDARAALLTGDLSEPREVVTLRLRLIGRNSANDNGYVNFNILAGDGLDTNDRAHLFSMDFIGRTIRGTGFSYGNNDELLDISVIFNNSSEVIFYAGPGGIGQFPLIAGRASVWVNGIQTISDSNAARLVETGPVRAVSLQIDTASIVSFDLGSLAVFDGAVVAGDFPPLLIPPMATVGSDGRLEYTTDSKGNRIPDFSNAGYMGGGVPIPDVPVKRTLTPLPGDNRVRIQAAVDEVSTLPLDENGFRGAVLLKAGEYEIGDTLRISASGVVLRGEGDDPDGTILRATRRARHDVIEVGGSGSWAEVAETRRKVTDAYVPVGARSFHVTDTSGYNAGDTIIVYRPSTAAWISALGMDQIPPRTDGLPVSQWTPGSRDLRFDRVITAIDGNKITIDAPLTNALESEYGGGYIYRYTFPGRIAQVGIEGIRGISEYEGGAWNTEQFDVEHAWTFIAMDRVQNGWVRDTTALHFGFGNTMIHPRAKWITVQDSQNLQPVSPILGGYRYPFYMLGQLSLVQRCYANHSRHDFGTSSLTVGPNVFLNSSADHSNSDTGPHQRWAVGTLYDNIHVPDHDIAVQNRLSAGSGHGWAGANHVVWNSSARRIVVQNPPTAQNWAIGVVGSKWGGANPDYAEDGYWVSHGVPVEPRSLYLKQLEDRLAPEGTGGAISIVSFFTNTRFNLKPGESLRLPVSRQGNRDGRIKVRFVIEGGDTDWIDAPEFIEIPANQDRGYLDIKLDENAPLGDEQDLRIRILHGTGYSVGRFDTTGLVIPPTPFGAWRKTNFSEEQLNDPPISGPNATPAGDGIENLLKYALNLAPFESAATEDLPKATIRDGRLTLTFDRGDDRTDIEYRVEVSKDLIHWQTGESVTEKLDISGDGNWKRLTIADRTPAKNSKRRFIRLHVRFKE